MTQTRKFPSLAVADVLAALRVELLPDLVVHVVVVAGQTLLKVTQKSNLYMSKFRKVDSLLKFQIPHPPLVSHPEVTTKLIFICLVIFKSRYRLFIIKMKSILKLQGREGE